MRQPLGEVADVVGKPVLVAVAALVDVRTAEGQIGGFSPNVQSGLTTNMTVAHSNAPFDELCRLPSLWQPRPMHGHDRSSGRAAQFDTARDKGNYILDKAY
jgi:hypothetical protein